MPFESTDFFTLVGKTITHVSENNLSFATSDGSQYRFHHYQDCCETVELHTLIGDPQQLVGKPIIFANDDHEEPPFESEIDSLDSHTWTHFRITAGDTTVDWWFLGESNGYYSEDVEFEILTESTT